MPGRRYQRIGDLRFRFEGSQKPDNGACAMEYDVFLSHSSKDRADVDRVRDELEALGYRVCVDYEVLPTITPE